MQQYETYTFGAVVTLDHHDIGYSDDDLLELDQEALQEVRAELTDAVLEELEKQLIEEIEDSASITANRKSYIKRFLGVEEPQRKTVRRKRAR